MEFLVLLPPLFSSFTGIKYLLLPIFIQKGDAAIDATCGNVYDTLAMVKIVADESTRVCVFAMDIQTDTLENTSLL
ncbi:hypothetical protein CFP56_029687 [Quercus suber]|uniref:Porphobilinogen synthase n=1 Tax=Quercus suber TaxID=58331 RepID=A0AAW0JRZ0_QUESU